MNSFQLLQTITGDGKGNHDDEGEDSAEELESSAARRLCTSQSSKKHLNLLANELAADKTLNGQWSSSSSDSSSPIEDVKLHMLNGSHSHADLKGANEVGVTPALRRRRERAEKQRCEQEDITDTAVELPDSSFTISRKNIQQSINNLINY